MGYMSHRDLECSVQQHNQRIENVKTFLKYKRCELEFTMRWNTDPIGCKIAFGICSVVTVWFENRKCPHSVLYTTTVFCMTPWGYDQTTGTTMYTRSGHSQRQTSSVASEFTINIHSHISITHFCKYQQRLLSSEHDDLITQKGPFTRKTPWRKILYCW